MKLIYVITVLATLIGSSAFAQRATTRPQKVKPKARKIDGIPEAFPTDPKYQRKWFIRWTIKGRMPTTVIATFISLLEDEKDKLEDLAAKEKDRSKPRKGLLRYYKKYMEWDDLQIALLTEISSLKSQSYIYSKDHPVHIKKREEFENKIKEKSKEFRKVINQKPSKPE